MESISLDNDVYVARIAYNARGQRILVAYDHPDLTAPFMTRYAYDPVNFRLLRQMKRVEAASGDRLRWFEDGTTTAAYLYDAGGKRVKKLVRNGSGNSMVTVYIDGGLLTGTDFFRVFVRRPRSSICTSSAARRSYPRSTTSCT